MNVLDLLRISFLLQYKWVLIFYALVLLWVALKKDKFEFQAKVIGLYKTSLGLVFLEKNGKRFRPLIKLLGYIGVGIGFAGMVFITAFLLRSFIDLFSQPNAPPAFALALPGVRVPGSPIFIPFWYGIITLFLVTVVHEVSHGLVAIAYNIKVKSTGIALFGPLFGAFVEPDEEELKKKSDIVQYSLFAAGPFSNILFALLAMLLLTQVVLPLQGAMLETEGYSFFSITPFSPAFNASVPAHTVFTHLNGQKVGSEQQFLSILDKTHLDDSISISNEQLSYTFSPVKNQNRPGKGMVIDYVEIICDSCNEHIIEAEDVITPDNDHLDILENSSLFHQGRAVHSTGYYAGETFSFPFTGKGMKLFFLRGPHQGKFSISIDGSLARIVDAGSNKQFLDSVTLDGLQNGNHKVVITDEEPENGAILIGISGQGKHTVQIYKSSELINSAPINKFLFSALDVLNNLFFWIVMLSSGIGIANLLPLGPVDGGRMLHTALQSLMQKKRATQVWAKISYLIFIIVVISFFLPIIRAILKNFNIFI